MARVRERLYLKLNNFCYSKYPKEGLSMRAMPSCPKCSSNYVYEDGNIYICPECAQEWAKEDHLEKMDSLRASDVNGSAINDGDTVVVVKDLKIKGSSSIIKVGTKIKNVRIVDGDHNIDCKVDGVGAIQLKSEFLRKVP
jgi:protein PhnA